ncbi:MAG: hypothetical protein C5S48_06745 [Candidatus Methanogaster sp.]|nr:MAG: hypothetical protein C5S48_06745 [ANME-2 cluster archaeon]
MEHTATNREFNRRVRREAQSGNKRLSTSSVPLHPPRLFFLSENTGSQSGDRSTYLSSYPNTYISEDHRYRRVTQRGRKVKITTLCVFCSLCGFPNLFRKVIKSLGSSPLTEYQRIMVIDDTSHVRNPLNNNHYIHSVTSLQPDATDYQWSGHRQHNCHHRYRFIYDLQDA